MYASTAVNNDSTGICEPGAAYLAYLYLKLNMPTKS